MIRTFIGGPLDGAKRDIPDDYNMWFVLIPKELTLERKKPVSPSKLLLRAFYELQPFDGEMCFVYAGVTPNQK